MVDLKDLTARHNKDSSDDHTVTLVGVNRILEGRVQQVHTVNDQHLMEDSRLEQELTDRSLTVPKRTQMNRTAKVLRLTVADLTHMVEAPMGEVDMSILEEAHHHLAQSRILTEMYNHLPGDRILSLVKQQQEINHTAVLAEDQVANSVISN